MNRDRKGTRKPIRALVLVSTLSAALLCCWCFVTPEPGLIDRAVRVADTRTWGEGGKRFNNSIGWHWLSDHELLFDRFKGPLHDRRTIYRRDLRTGRDTELPGLTAARDQLSEEVIDSQCVSPDGKWFVCSARWGDCLLAEVNGKRRYLYSSVQDDAYRSILWLPDCRHWLERYGQNGRVSRMVLHDIENPQLSIPLAAASHPTAATMDAVVQPNTAVLFQIDGRPAEGEIRSEDGPPTRPGRRATVSLVPWTGGGSPIARYAFEAPAGMAPYYDAVSPDAKHVLWCAATQRKSQFLDFLHRFWPTLGTAHHRSTTLWTTRIDGSRLTKLGSIIEPTDSDEGMLADGPVYLNRKWMPGGNSLSFEKDGSLYVIPLD